MKYKISILLFLIVILISSFYTVNATVLSGTLQDSNGAPLSNTDITLDDGNGEQFTIGTDDNGNFRFDLDNDNIYGSGNIDENSLKHDYSNKEFSFSVDGERCRIGINNYQYTINKDLEYSLVYPNEDENALKKMTYINEQLSYVYKENSGSFESHIKKYDNGNTNILGSALEDINALKTVNNTAVIIFMYVNGYTISDLRDYMQQINKNVTKTYFILIADDPSIYDRLDSMIDNIGNEALNPSNPNFKRFSLMKSSEISMQEIIKQTSSLNKPIFNINGPNMDTSEKDSITIEDPHDNFATEDMIVTVDDDGSTPPGGGGRRRNTTSRSSI